jgi:hypothetical protein
MYKDGEVALKEILDLVDKCPKEFQQKCFEVLLSGYVESEVASLVPARRSTKPTLEDEKKPDNLPANPAIPTPVLNRFRNTAKRLEVSHENLEGLFDFSVDPFVLQAITVPGKGVAEKTRNVALLAASRSYMAAGTWSADWQEVKSLCIDHSCYGGANHLVNLEKGKGSLFKSVERGKTLELSSAGVQEAEKLLKSLAGESAK